MNSPRSLDTLALLQRIAASHAAVIAGLVGGEHGASGARCGANASGLEDVVATLEDIAINALASLALAEDYEAALAVMEESGTAGWLWGVVLNRALATAGTPANDFAAAYEVPPGSPVTCAPNDPGRVGGYVEQGKRAGGPLVRPNIRVWTDAIRIQPGR
jgi:hypothetical protein